MQRSARSLAWLLAVSVAGCSGGDDTAPRDAGVVDARPTDARPLADAYVPCVASLPVDLLFVVDNSNSMAEEQLNLAANFPTLLSLLTSPPDEDRNGRPDYPPIEDLRVAIVTTDVGVGTESGVEGCEPGLGDRGAFVAMSRATTGGCVGVTSGDQPWLSYRAGESTADVATRFSCLANLGTDGCGLEQQLEAMHRALVDEAGTGGPNAGFLRGDSLVGVVLLTDEDDCSAADTSLFDPSPSARMTLGPFDTRCAENPSFLHPVARYVAMLENLRLDRANDVVVAAITGVPRRFVEDPFAVDFDALLASEEMQYRRDGTNPNRLAPACSFGGVGSAVPARRIVELVRPFAASGDGVVQSICDTSFEPAVRAVARMIGRRICPPPI